MNLAIKRTGPDRIEGLAMPFHSKDVQGETFTPETDLCIDWFGKSGRPILYDHGFDATLKGTSVGAQTDYEEREDGIWAMGELKKNVRYRKAIDKLIDEGALGYSSGAYPHLATKNAAGEITRWPWVELSLTPIPAHPATLGVHYVKSADLVALLEEGDVPIPDPLKAALDALDEWADSRDTAPVPERLADRLDRVSVELDGLRTHAHEYVEMKTKAGRVLSARTRERLTRHPASLRELADDLDELLTSADSEKETKSLDASDLRLESDRILSRLLGVPIPTTTEGVTQ